MRTTACAILLTISVMCLGVPARRDAISVRQPDGSHITVYLHGDETYHWLTNEAGERIERQADGNYITVQAPTEEAIEQMRKVRHVTQPQHIACPLNIAPRGIVLLANFQDATFSTPIAEMDSMLNGKNYTRHMAYTHDGKDYDIHSEGSAGKYFKDQSMGAYQPHFDIKGPYTVSNNFAYYGKNDYSNNDKNPEQMIIEVCQAAAADGVDFSQYDYNNDGKIDFVYVFYAGYGEADGGPDSTIWPHKYELSTYYYNSHSKVYLNNKLLDDYACGNELNWFSKQHDGIGTFCHEFGHVLGLPDIYTTNNKNHKTCGMWDIMDYGPYNNEGNTPPAYTSYERFFLGWLTPRLLTEGEQVTLHDMKESNEAALISGTDEHNLTGNDPNPNTFYILENRQQTGWDQYIPGHGMLITKIQYSYYVWKGNTVNNNEQSMGIDIIEADGLAPSYKKSNRKNGYFGKEGDTFPTGADSYTAIEGHPITNITEVNGNIYFTYKTPSGTEYITSQETSTHKANKQIYKGNLYIEKDNIIYDLSGRKIQ